MHTQMRNVIVIILLVMVGTVLTVNMLFSKEAMSSPERTEVTTTCLECHSKPVYPNANYVHTRHKQLGCTTCHPDSPPVVNFDACKACHGVPEYENESTMHDIHVALNCSRCHREELMTTDNFHHILEWLSIGALISSLAGISVSFIMVNRKRMDQK